MKILIMSDSHKNTDNMLEAVNTEAPDYILHLGDHEQDCSIIREIHPDIPLRAVRGNCDGASAELEIDEFVLDDKRFVMTHGNLFSVKLGTSRLKEFGLAKSADILLFGHTHRPVVENYFNMLVVNPGSIGYSKAKTYAVITLDNGKADCRIIGL